MIPARAVDPTNERWVGTINKFFPDKHYGFETARVLLFGASDIIAPDIVAADIIAPDIIAPDISHQSTVISSQHVSSWSITTQQVHQSTSNGRKIIKIDAILVPVHPHGPIIGPKEAYHLQEAF